MLWQCLTPCLTLPFLSPTICKTIQGCRDGVDCEDLASNPEWHETTCPAVVAVKFIVCKFPLKTSSDAQPQGLYVQAEVVSIHQCT